MIHIGKNYMEFFLAVVIFLVLLFSTPYALYLSLRWSRRSKGPVKDSLGHAFQELDRLVVRPSAEHKVSHENAVVRIEDERGGE